MQQRGLIFAEQAYAQSKMLDHSGWQNKERPLPRKITASDIDFVFDNLGFVLYGELHRGRTEWKNLKFGQRLMYENLIKNTPNCAVLCIHESPHDRAIRTREDVIAFQPMFYDFGIVVCATCEGNEAWQKFVEEWTKSPATAREMRRRALSQAETDPLRALNSSAMDGM